MVCLILQGVTEPVMRVGRGREEGEREAALEDSLHVLGGEGGLTVGGDGVKEVTAHRRGAGTHTQRRWCSGGRHGGHRGGGTTCGGGRQHGSGAGRDGC